MMIHDFVIHLVLMARRLLEGEEGEGEELKHCCCFPLKVAVEEVEESSYCCLLLEGAGAVEVVHPREQVVFLGQG